MFQVADNETKRKKSEQNLATLAEEGCWVDAVWHAREPSAAGWPLSDHNHFYGWLRGIGELLPMSSRNLQAVFADQYGSLHVNDHPGVAADAAQLG